MNRHAFTMGCVLLQICLLFESAAMGRIVYVDDDAGGANDGSSWVNAFAYLQTALTVARAGDEVRVAQGVYRPDQGLPPTTKRGRFYSTLAEGSTSGSAGAVFQLKNGVAILGGFAGMGAEDPDTRDPERYRTVLSGDLRGNDVDLWGPGNPLYDMLRTDNSLHVVHSQDTDATAVLDGFVIQSAVDSGLLNLGGSPAIANCVFLKDFTLNSGGGGLRCEGGQPTLTNCLFQENSAAHFKGGAIYARGARLTLSDCRFIGNWAGSEGGALYCIDGDLSLTRCEFERNGAGEGGAIHQTSGTLTLVECAFEGNAATQGGAAAFAVEAASMTRCVFAKNWAAGSGGAIENAGTFLTLDACSFSGNTAGEGGAIYAFRLLSPQIAGGPGTSMTRCIFAGNRALGTGGALYSAQTEFTILGCTFADNWARTAATLGWLIRAGDAVYRLSLENCIVRDGYGSIAQAVYATRSRGTTSEEPKPDVAIRYSNVQGWPGEGNFNADPRFAGPGHWVNGANPGTVVESSHTNATWVEGDYHLKSQAGRWDPASESWVEDEVTSPCIDAGDPNAPVGDEPEPNGGRINMGAYGGTAEASKSP